jgi:hypothetical protein
MLAIQWIDVEALKASHHQARTHSKKQIREIANAIVAFGFLVPILVDAWGVIIAGHGRWEASKLLGLRQVPVIKVEGLSETKIRALALADNKIAENAGWDREKLAIEIPELSELLIVEGLDISVTGFATPEIDQMVDDFEEDTADPADSINPDWAELPPVSRRGDFWELCNQSPLAGRLRLRMIRRIRPAPITRSAIAALRSKAVSSPANAEIQRAGPKASAICSLWCRRP